MGHGKVARLQNDPLARGYFSVAHPVQGNSLNHVPARFAHIYLVKKAEFKSVHCRQISDSEAGQQLEVSRDALHNSWLQTTHSLLPSTIHACMHAAELETTFLLKKAVLN